MPWPANGDGIPAPGWITYASPRSAPLADRGEQRMGPCQGRCYDVVVGGRRRKPGTRRHYCVAGRGRRTARGTQAQFIKRRFIGGVLKHSARPLGRVILIAPCQQGTHCRPQGCALVAEPVLAAPGAALHPLEESGVSQGFEPLRED